MRVLVTGGAGFIGSHVVDCLVARGHQTVVLDDLSTGRYEHLRHGAETLEFVRGDVTDPQTVAACAKDADAIVHLAAIASVRQTVLDPIGTHRVNVGGTVAVLEAARSLGVEYVLFSSTAAVYGDAERLPVSETDWPKPRSPYAADKLASELHCQVAAEDSSLQTQVFRFFNVYGPRQDPHSPYSGVISLFRSALLDRRPLRIFGDGGQSRDFVFVKDVASLMVQAVETRPVGHSPLNVATGTSITLIELAEEMQRLLGQTVPLVFEPPREGDVYRSAADVANLKRAFPDWNPRTLSQGLEDLLMDQRHGNHRDGGAIIRSGARQS